MKANRELRTIGSNRQGITRSDFSLKNEMPCGSAFTFDGREIKKNDVRANLLKRGRQYDVNVADTPRLFRYDSKESDQNRNRIL